MEANYEQIRMQVLKRLQLFHEKGCNIYCKATSLKMISPPENLEKGIECEIATLQQKKSAIIQAANC